MFTLLYRVTFVGFVLVGSRGQLAQCDDVLDRQTAYHPLSQGEETRREGKPKGLFGERKRGREGEREKEGERGRERGREWKRCLWLCAVDSSWYVFVCEHLCMHNACIGVCYWGIKASPLCV